MAEQSFLRVYVTTGIFQEDIDDHAFSIGGRVETLSKVIVAKGFADEI